MYHGNISVSWHFYLKIKTHFYKKLKTHVHKSLNAYLVKIKEKNANNLKNTKILGSIENFNVLKDKINLEITTVLLIIIFVKITCEEKNHKVLENFCRESYFVWYLQK